jgi:hypothetical protein
MYTRKETVTIQVDLNEYDYENDCVRSEEHDVTVLIEGRYTPATYDYPAEHPDVTYLYMDCDDSDYDTDSEGFYECIYDQLETE